MNRKDFLKKTLQVALAQNLKDVRENILTTPNLDQKVDVDNTVEVDDSPTETGCPCCDVYDQTTPGGCFRCLAEAIQQVETGGLADDTIVGGVRGCNTCGDGGRSCGPHQIGKAYIRDACEACPDYCAQFGGAQGVIDKIHNDCPQEAAPEGETDEERKKRIRDCCTLKVIIGEHLIGCYSKRYGELPGFSCKCKNKNPQGKECCSCEEIAKRHQGGYKGPCNDTPVRRRYWSKVKAIMSSKCPHCANCTG